jgi:L-ribulose-5-phosphate 4-epimerase
MKHIDNTKKIVYEINYKLSKSNLVIQNFGNGSQRVSESEFIIKPSGVDLDTVDENDMSHIYINNQSKNSGLKPSSDEPTHREIYKNSEFVGGIVHTHSQYATAYAQAVIEIENLGTTHSDFAKSSILCARPLTKSEIENNYEKNTGIVIHETLKKHNLDYLDLPGMLVAHHGVFSWGKNLIQAFKNAEIIEYLAKMNLLTKSLNPKKSSVPDYLSSKHFNRKHGPDSYYGQ